MTERPPRRRGRIALFLALAALLAVPTVAAAHAELHTSDPEDGSTVEGSPNVIVGDFTAALRDDSSMILVDSAGDTIAEARIHEFNDTRMIIDPPELEPGQYRVRWTAIAEDGHIERGRFSFTVAAAATPAQTPEPEPSPTPAATDSVPTEPPAPTAAPTAAPSPVDDGTGEPTAGAGDVLLPIVAAIVLVAVLGGYLLSRRRTTARP